MPNVSIHQYRGRMGSPDSSRFPFLHQLGTRCLCLFLVNISSLFIATERTLRNISPPVSIGYAPFFGNSHEDDRLHRFSRDGPISKVSRWSRT